MRSRPALLGALATVLLATTAAVAQAPAPTGNFGGGGLVAPPKDDFGPGNAVVAIRALPGRRLEIEATVRGSCGGGDFSADAQVAADGSFKAAGTEKTRPAPKQSVTTTFKIAGAFTSPSAIDGTVSARIDHRTGGTTKTCRSGAVKYGARRPDGVIGAVGAPPAARYYGTTSQRGVGPRRPIVLRVSSDGLVISRALFGESVHCSDHTQSIGLEAPRTNAAIDADGGVDDHEHFTIRQGDVVVKVNDSFTARLGATGAAGTFSLNDETSDKHSGRVLRTCHSGLVKWTAAL